MTSGNLCWLAFVAAVADYDEHFFVPCAFSKVRKGHSKRIVQCRLSVGCNSGQGKLQLNRLWSVNGVLSEAQMKPSR